MIAQCAELDFNPFRQLLKKVSQKKPNKLKISNDNPALSYHALGSQRFKPGLTAVVQTGVSAALIHRVQFEFIMLNTLHEDFIFYLHLPLLSETLRFMKHAKHKLGRNLSF